MSSGQQDYYDSLREEADREEKERLERDSARLGINPITLEQLREFKIAFNNQINVLPYGVVNNLKRLLDKINTN